jgi:hypothetical protein
MTVSAPIRVMCPEALTAQSGGPTPFLLLADPHTLFGAPESPPDRGGG